MLSTPATARLPAPRSGASRRRGGERRRRRSGGRPAAPTTQAIRTAAPGRSPADRPSRSAPRRSPRSRRPGACRRASREAASRAGRDGRRRARIGGPLTLTEVLSTPATRPQPASSAGARCSRPVAARVADVCTTAAIRTITPTATAAVCRRPRSRPGPGTIPGSPAITTSRPHAWRLGPPPLGEQDESADRDPEQPDQDHRLLAGKRRTRPARRRRRSRSRSPPGPTSRSDRDDEETSSALTLDPGRDRARPDL